MDSLNASIKITWNPGDRKGVFTLVASPPSGDPYTDSVRIVSAKAREKFADAVCEKFPGLDWSVVDSELSRIAAEVAMSERPPKDADDKPSREELLAHADAATEAALDETDDDARRDAEELLRDPFVIDRILSDIEAVGVVGERDLALLAYALGTSRLLDKPLAAIIQGASSSGKSFVPMRVSKLFPVEALFIATDITPNALYYGAPGSLMHKWVVAGERRRGRPDDNAEATRALREMIETGELNKVVTMPNPDGTGFLTQNVHQDGPIAYSESTTLTQLFDEDANRCLLPSTDETPAQTRRVVDAQAAAAQGEIADADDVRRKHHAAQRMLKRVTVWIPYASIISARVPIHHQEARRALPMIYNTIRAVALLHQFQRLGKPPKHGDLIVATAADYAVARRLLAGPMGRSLGGALPDAVVRFAERLSTEFGGEMFTTNEVVARRILSKGKVNEYLAVLAERGVTECMEESRGNKPSKWKVVGDIPSEGADWLPRAEEVDPHFVPTLQYLKSGAAGQQAGKPVNDAGNAAPASVGSLGGSSGSKVGATPPDPKLPQSAGGSNSTGNQAENGELPCDPLEDEVVSHGRFCRVPGHTRGWREVGDPDAPLTCGLCHPPVADLDVEWSDRPATESDRAASEEAAQ
jgi:hypothetical protein